MGLIILPIGEAEIQKKVYANGSSRLLQEKITKTRKSRDATKEFVVYCAVGVNGCDDDVNIYVI